MFRHKISKLLALILTLALTAGMVPALAAEPIAADSVYRNGHIYTMNKTKDTTTAMAIKGTKLLYVGDEAGVEAYIGAATKVVDLGGKTVIPGLIDSHMHVDKYGNSLLGLDIAGKPKDVTLRIIAEAVENAAPGEWISASGWNETIWADPVYPTKEDLDAVAPNNPVSLGRSCGHMSWANSLAFQLAGVTKDTPNPQGGEYLKNPDGTLQGCMTDAAGVGAGRPKTETTPEQAAASLKKAMMEAQGVLFSLGITSAMDAGVSVSRIEDYKKLYEDGSLKLRLYPLLRLSDMDSSMAEYLLANPMKPEEQYDDHLSVRCVKIFADGALGARGAWFLEDYSDRPGHKGDFKYTDAQMDELVGLAYKQGYQIAIHAIGDAAVHQVIGAYEKVLTANPREDHRLRIEHFQIVKPEDIDRALDLGIIPAMQFTHAITDMLMAEDRVGAERLKGAYAWRTVLDKGGIIPGGTDAPFDRVNPFHCMYAGVTRVGLNGLPKGGWRPEECITRMEALTSYTNSSAYAHFEEDIKGSLEVGKLADFAVLDRDLMTCPALDMKDTQVLLTVSGGEEVYKKDSSVPTVMWQGKALEFFSDIVIEPGSIYVPATDLATGISATRAAKDAATTTFTLDGKTVDAATKSIGGVDYVAVRAVLEGLGANVNWYPLSACVSTAR